MAANTNQAFSRFPHVIEVQDSVTRPADTTAYADGDAISDNATTPTAAGYFIFTFNHKAGGGLTFKDFTLHKSDHDTTNATFNLLLFTTLPALAGFEDNAAIAITDAEMLECKGVVNFPAASWVNVGTGDVMTVPSEICVVPASTGSTVYGILQAGAGYTPASGEIFTVTAHAMLD